MAPLSKELSGALMKITCGRYGNRDQRPKGSVHRKPAQMAENVTD
jgi:hypothetical protein